ncbi:MAG: dTDP-4-dehydrorhamnose reductase [Desulfobulbaceae bacterium]|nr:dTDP-4-dehydrorhamnose reductase [Desulfobulbaceae bacterium]
MRIVIVGANGQLGRDSIEILGPNHTVWASDATEVDITDQSQVQALFQRHQPDVVINCAAFTAVDACESNVEASMAVNARGPELLALACREHGSRLIQVSTDYVFDGARPAPQPYLEEDTAQPTSMYGKSKLAGEEAVQAVLENHLIVRTAWLYGIGNKNFLKTMLRLAISDPKRIIKVVNDQHGSLTWSWRLALQIERLLSTDLTGIVHATAEGHSTWYEGARYFLDCMQVPYNIVPCTTAEYPTPARRPANSILENDRLKEHGCNLMLSWQEDVRLFAERYREELLAEAKAAA